MTKFVSGLLIGFFLATLLMFGYINMQLAPAQNEIQLLKTYSDAAYVDTHSESYANIRQIAVSLKDLSSSLAELPIIGSTIDSSKVAEYSATMTSLLDNVKAMSETSKTFLETVLFLLNISLAMVIISVVMLAAGGYLYYKEESEGKPARNRKG